MVLRTASLVACACLVVFALTGCSNGQPRFKGIDSYNSATKPNSYDKLPPMDPYSYGGTAYASGGLAPAASYGTGATGAFDGDPGHYIAMIAAEGNNAPPVDWGGGAKDTSGLIQGSQKTVVEEAERDR